MAEKELLTYLVAHNLIRCVMAEAALARTESRGVHMRTDYPDTNNDDWRKHLVYQFAAE